MGRTRKVTRPILTSQETRDARHVSCGAPVTRQRAAANSLGQ